MKKSEEEVKKIRKSEWKKEAKEKIVKEVKKEIEEQRKIKTKLRFNRGFGRQEYINKYNMAKVREIMTIRLNMTELKTNFKGKYTDTLCPACGSNEETTEHVVECQEYKRLTNHSLDEEEKSVTDRMNNPTWLLKATRTFKQIEETRKWLLKKTNNGEGTSESS